MRDSYLSHHGELPRWKKLFGVSSGQESTQEGTDIPELVPAAAP